MKNTSFKYFLSLIQTSSSVYIFSTIIVSIIGFGRSFLMMKYLDYNFLGWITILQTLIQLVSFFQIGLLNGGYRIYCSEEAQKTRVNNTNISYLILLSAFSIILIILLKSLNLFNSYRIDIILLGIFIGIVSMLKNWITNVLIAESRLMELSIIDFISNFFAMIFIFTIPYFGFFGGVISICISPIIFISYAIFKYPIFRLTRFDFELKYVKYILKFGFVPFLAAIFVQFSAQIERWSITSFLGVSELGKYYLPFFITGLYAIVPNALNSIYFPKAMRLYNIKDYNGYLSEIKEYMTIIIIYSLSTSILLVLFLEPSIKFFLPKHLIGIQYVYYLLPGLIAISLTGPLSVVFNTIVKFKFIFWGNLIGVLITGISVVILTAMNRFSLFSISIVKTLTGLQLFAAYLYGIWCVRKFLIAEFGKI